MKKYENFASALANLEDAPNQDLNNDFVQSGLINKFNLQFELSWKLLKRLLEYEGATLAASGSPRAILKESYRFYDFIDEAAWLDMLRDRNTNVHIYDNKLAQDLIQRILNVYIPAFCQLRDGLMERYGELLMAPDDQFVERVAELLGCEKEAVLKSMADFEGLPHRLQYVGTYRGVRYYDDSISTIPEAAINAAMSIPDAGSQK